MDLHVKVVSFPKKRHPHSLFTVTSGENQDTVFKRIDSFKKGYLRGSPDLIINNLHKHCTGFCIEFKSLKGNGVLSPDHSSELYEFIDRVCIEIHEIHTDLNDATYGFYL